MKKIQHKKVIVRHPWSQLWLCALVFAVLLIILPLLRHGFFVSDDGEWMIIRLSSFFQTFRDGQFPVRFLGRLNHGFGYPVSNFLYPGYLYLGSILHIFGFSFVDAVKVILVGSVLIGCICIYKWLRKFFSSSASVIGSIFFILSPYLVFDIYTRGSVGELLALAAVSLCLWSIETEKNTFFSLSLALLLVSHNSMALLFTPFLMGYILIRQRHDLWIPAVMGIGMTTFFWFPAISEQRFIQFNQVQVSQPLQYFSQSMSFVTGGFGVFGMILILFWSKLKYTTLYMYMIVAFVVALFLATRFSSFLWSNIVATLFQFPYRFMPLATLACAWILAAVAEVSAKKTQVVLMAGISLYLLVSVLPILKHVNSNDRPISYYTTNEGTTTVANEYMTRWARIFPSKRTSSPLVLYQGQGSIELLQYNTQKIVAQIKTSEQSVVQQNTLYYPGWGVLINNLPADILYKNELGVIRVALPPGTYTYTSEFRETVPRFIADIVSIISLAALSVYAMVKRTIT